MPLNAFRLCVAVVAIATHASADPDLLREGRVIPLRVLDILPSVEGIVTNVNFKDGADVPRGAVLFELDDLQQRAQVDSCRAGLFSAEAELRRSKQLYQRMSSSDSRGTTALELDEAKVACEVAQWNRDQAAASLAAAEHELSRMCIRAPFAGRMGLSAATVGSLAATYREPLARLVQMDPIRVVFEYPIDKRGQSDLSKIRLALANAVDYEHPGRVDFENNETTEDGRSIVLGATFPNPDGKLIPGMKVTVRIGQ